MPGRTEHYQQFLDTWASHCGAPRSVFRGQFDVTLAAELDAALEQVAAGQMPALVKAATELVQVGRFAGAPSGAMNPRERWVQVPAREIEALERAVSAVEDALLTPDQIP